MTGSVLARRAGRRAALQYYCAAVLIVSIAFSIAALVIRPRSERLVTAKVVLLFTAVVFEFGMMIPQLHKKLRHHISVAGIAERYGALTLIIL